VTLADFTGKPVLVTGGTMGIGLATALAFGRRGAHCTLTYRFGTAREDDVLRAFAEAGAPVPVLVQADAARADDTAALLDAMRARHDHVEVLVSNVSAALVVEDIADYSRKGLQQSIDFSAWPMVTHLTGIKERFGRYPRYALGMSSPGPDQYAKSYDFVAASKAVLETMCRYLSYRLYDEDLRINVIRSRSVKTESLRETFGSEFEAFAKRFTRDEHFVPAEEVANAAVALCSGLMDGFRGQVLTVDRGTSFFDNFMRLYNEREELGL
jgi:NAD(P)-dependent dehydrogenase (short-subunit alcohol dehydrogenase family)